MRIVDLLFNFGKLFSQWGTTSTIRTKLCSIFYSGYMSVRFHSFGKSSRIFPRVTTLIGGKFIDIGSNCCFGKNLSITAFSKWGKQSFTPNIKIGNNVSIGAYSHITCINEIIIEDNVLTGKMLLITDNSHGLSLRHPDPTPPLKRDLHSPGKVLIEKDVWIGEKVSILPNVTVGRGSIIAAHSVVNKSVPPYSLVAGCPAKVVRSFPDN